MLAWRCSCTVVHFLPSDHSGVEPSLLASTSATRSSAAGVPTSTTMNRPLERPASAALPHTSDAESDNAAQHLHDRAMHAFVPASAAAPGFPYVYAPAATAVALGSQCRCDHLHQSRQLSLEMSAPLL